MGKISHSNHKECCEVSNIFNQYVKEPSGVFSKNYQIPSYQKFNEHLVKGNKFDFYIEHANPEDLFYIELYVECKDGKERHTSWTEESIQGLEEVKKLLNELEDDITNERIEREELKPYQYPTITLSDTISKVKGEYYEIKSEMKEIIMIHQWENEDLDKSVMVFQTVPYSNEYERETAHEEYLMSDQYESDCKSEQWDWLKNEC